MNSELKSVFKAFLPDQEFLEVEELTVGHINDTFLVTTTTEQKYIFQRINSEVFPDVAGLILNKVKVSRHLHQKLSSFSLIERQRRILTFLQTADQRDYCIDNNGDFWNVTYFIDNSQTFETVHDSKIAFEGGKLFGEFIKLTQDMDPSELVEVIPRFHDMSYRFDQFEESLLKVTAERKEKAASLISTALDLKGEMHILQGLKEEGKIRIRVTHNDTKISNALFALDGKGLCVIDTDTVMPGIVHYDFGDAIRTICNSAAEDEKDLDKISFNKAYYEAYSQGFLEALGDSVSDLEKACFPLGAKTMIFIMALRFLTDYLNGDTYYKTEYPEHNLVRSKNQFKLIQSFDELMPTSIVID